MDTVLKIIQDCCEEVDPSLITEESRFLDDLELSSLDFFSLISNTAGGYHFFKDARLRRITRYRGGPASRPSGKGGIIPFTKREYML